MARLSRAYQAQFGVNGNQSNFGQFGSKAAGSPLTSFNPTVIQALTAFTQDGWLDAINSGNLAPFLEDMNGLHFLIFYQLCYLMQQGIPEWDPATPYYTNSIVILSGTTQMFGSLTDNNIGNPPTNGASNAYWTYLNAPPVPSGTISGYVGNPAPTGWLSCDGSAYLTANYPILSSVTPSIWRTFNGAADPGAGYFRVPDARGLTLIGYGSGVGFTSRTLGSLVGEETHTLTTAELAIHDHPLDDPGHDHTVNAGTGTGPNQAIQQVSAVNPNGQPTLSATSVGGTNASVGNAGGGAPHNNMQPSMAVQYIIKI